MNSTQFLAHQASSTSAKLNYLSALERTGGNSVQTLNETICFLAFRDVYSETKKQLSRWELSVVIPRLVSKMRQLDHEDLFTAGLRFIKAQAKREPTAVQKALAFVSRQGGGSEGWIGRKFVAELERQGIKID